jgi:excisionase family DNA binding protein
VRGSANHKSQAKIDGVEAPAERLLLSAPEVAGCLGIGVRTVWRLVATGELPAPVRLPGTRATRWRRADLDRFVEGLDGA